ncbi:MAG: cysteine desulfurase [Planctomycetaceae bacterium]|nr:cysteine desulfurase [Planctomycetaceae bacterium]MBT6156030.1 cysteine desulfurase [Planctomycetaceae bacterium]MBT6487529.1 cysteine desulfurase [Planctomycetaceae bacterium]MBT6495844.1 cysteine desulfurase [Planctomycetaceae bacterium]
MPDRVVYLDNHATTRVDPRVVEAMRPYWTEKYGNAASVSHAYGEEAADAVETARAQIAELLNATPRNLIFTSGATEANNLAIKGVIQAVGSSVHLIVNEAEHRAVLDPARKLKRLGCELTVLPVDKYGMVDPQSVAAAIQPNTALVSVMFANNEVGTINPVAEIGEICHERGVLFHCDAAQAVGKLPVDLADLPIDLLSLTAHKMYGPMGVGALYVRGGDKRIPIEPLFDGGGHERRLRSGTLPVPLIVGFGEACKLAAEVMRDESKRVQQLRDRLWGGLSEAVEGVYLNGHPDLRLAGNLNVSFDGVDGDALMMGLRDIAVSSGSACTSADPQPSHVLRAMGVSDELTRASLRFGLGRFTTLEEIEFAVSYVADAIDRLRRL